MGLQYIEEGVQIQRHEAVIQGTSGTPWQYRVLSDYLVEGLLLLVKALGLPRPVLVAFVVFRLVQNALIFMLASAYFRKLGLSTYVSVLGLVILTWSMSHALYDSDLQFSTYSDLIFYLLAGLAILKGNYLWLVPITLLAALNRESSVFIPFLLFGAGFLHGPESRERKSALLIGGISLLVYMAVYAGLRLVIGPRAFVGTAEIEPGLRLLFVNLTRARTWPQVFLTFSLVPVLALLSWRYWPRVLHIFFWVMVPLWVLIHFYASVVAETRLFLVPFSLIIIPAALFGLNRLSEGTRKAEV